MEITKLFSKNSFVIILLFVLIHIILMNTGIYYFFNWLSQGYSFDSATEMENGLNHLSEMIQRLDWIEKNLFKVIFPVVTCFFLIFGALLWRLLKTALAKIVVLRDPSETPKTTVKNKEKKDFVDQKIEQERKKRLYLHSLSVLQREGRILDFFAEDLSLYEDEQIGVAVRSIQEDCKRAIKKYIDPKPVIEKQEGEAIMVESGFDNDSITLVGNVSGMPPFKGVVRHRGWKAGKNEIPKLSDILDASVIIPAEVEIQ